MIYLKQNMKQIFHLIYNLYKIYKDIIKLTFFILILINMYFFLIYYNANILIYIYNNLFIYKLDPIIYFFKDNYIKFIDIIYNSTYNFKLFLIQKYYSIIEYNFTKKIIRNYTFVNSKSEKSYYNINNFILYIYKNIFFPYINIFQNTEYYKKFEPRKYNLDFIYDYKRKGDCSKFVSDDLLFEYLPDMKKKKLKSKVFACKMDIHYNYIYTSKHLRRKSLYLYNDLFLRRNFFIIENNIFSNKELMHYTQDLQASNLDEMTLLLEEKIMKKISAFNFRRKDPTKPLTSFENFTEFENTADAITYENALIHNKDPNFDPHKARRDLDKLSYNLLIKRLKQHSYYDNLLKISILEKDIDNFYITGTTEIFYFDKNKYRLINFIGLSDYFFFFLYYSFIEVPFFFEDLYININKNTDIIYIFKIIFNEIIRLNNFYVILIFIYAFYLFFRTLILNELDLLYSLLFFKRHLTLLVIIGFIIKFNLDILDPLSFELFLLIWIPVFINYIVYEEWWWIWWTNYEKVKYHFTYNYEGALHGPINIYLAYLIIPSYLQNFIIFKLLILYYLIFHFNRIDLKWKYPIRKNILFYIFIIYNLIIYNLFFFKEEINLLKSRYNMSRKSKNFNIFELNFNIYSRSFLININNVLSTSLLIILKKYIQFFIFYIYTFFFILVILLMFFKIIYNLNLILYINFTIENDLDLLNFSNKSLSFYLFIKNNLNLALFKEYQIIQSDHYSKYNILYEYKNINGFVNKLYYKFHYPGLIFYRTSRQFNGNLYWLFFQGGNNFVGENYYKATILNSFYKKNLSYFYKYFLFDSKNRINWNLNQKTNYFKMSNLKKKFVQIKKIKRLLPNYSLKYNSFFKESDFNNNTFNFINYNDIRFISLITKNFYKNTTYYTNNKTYFFSLYTYKYYNLNYPLFIDDIKISFFLRKMSLYSRAWGTYHMGSNFLPVYGKLILNNHKYYTYSSQYILDIMKNECENDIPFKFLLKKYNITNIELYNKYIPNRLDYIKFHSVFYDKIYSLYQTELKQTIADKYIVKKEEVIKEDNFINLFNLIFNYSKYVKARTERDLSDIISIKDKVSFIYDKHELLKDKK